MGIELCRQSFDAMEWPRTNGKTGRSAAKALAQVRRKRGKGCVKRIGVSEAMRAIPFLGHNSVFNVKSI
jgi:hypothetical protein